MITDASVLQLAKNRKIFGKSQLYQIKNSMILSFGGLQGKG